MTTPTIWKQPDWIYVVERKIKAIDLTKFPSSISLEHRLIHPEKNKYIPEWALCVDVRLAIKDRINGRQTALVNPEGIYLYSADNFEQIVYAEIERLLVHELKECFQIRESYADNAIIPFDPHDAKKSRIKFGTYDKVDFYRHYPKWNTGINLAIKKWCKARIVDALDTLFLAGSKRLIRLPFKPKALPPKQKEQIPRVSVIEF